MAARLHADEIQPSGGAELAAEIGALSADHLGAISDAGIEALGRAADDGQPVVATLLPLTSFYLDEPAYAPARRLIERGVPVAWAPTSTRARHRRPTRSWRWRSRSIGWACRRPRPWRR